MDRRYMVKQYVAVVRTQTGQRFRVFETGNEKWYLFDPLVPGCDSSGCIQFPVEKRRLRDDLRRALSHGRGNSL
jgi:hypothetical protein